MHVELTDRGEHRVPLKVFDVSGGDVFDALAEGKVDHIVVAVVDADVVELDVPVAESHLMQLSEGGEDLLAHVRNFLLELDGPRGCSALHVRQPRLIQVNAAVRHQ